MAAITGVTVIPTLQGNHEVVIGTASDGETYTSGKLATLSAAGVSLMEDLSSSITVGPSCAISTNIVTIHCPGLSDAVVKIDLWGK